MDEVDYLFKEYNKETNELSQESLEKTKELLNYISERLRFDYDNFNTLVSSNSFKNFSKVFIERGEAADKKEMITHIFNVKMQTLSSELKKRFIHLINVEE